MKVNQTFPKQMKDSDQEQSEDEAGVLRAVVIRSNPRHGRASRFLPRKTGYCSSAAPGKPLSTSSWPRWVLQPKVGHQGKAALGVTRGKVAEQKWLPCHASIEAWWCSSKEAVDLRSREMFELQGLPVAFLLQARGFSEDSNQISKPGDVASQGGSVVNSVNPHPAQKASGSAQP